MNYTFKDNTYSAIPKNDSKDRIEIEVGDSKQTDFYPQVKLARWDNEVNCSFRLKHNETNPVVNNNNGKIKWVGDKVEAHFYDIEDGYEFEVLLKEKPTTNKVEFTVNTKELDFFYTPIDYDAEEIKDNAFRPENVKGSYAVYHKTKSGDYSGLGKMNYRAGKVGHIYRPKIKDADGNETWGVLGIKNDLLTITIDQKFLNDAVYPVIVDPTFGYTSTGASSAALAVDTIRSWIYTPSEAGSLYAIYVYQDPSASTTKWRATLYLDSDLSRLSWGSEVTSAGAVGWYQLPITKYTFTNVAYRLGFWLGGVAPTYYYDAGATVYRDNYTYHSTNDPVNPCVDDATLADRKHSIYGVYAKTTAGTYTETYSTAGTFYWVAPTGVTSVAIEAWGGGASGEGSDTSNGGKGGGGGAYAADTSVVVTPESIYPIIVGAGGVGGVLGHGVWNNGGDSSFNTTDVVAKGAIGEGGGSDTGSTGDTKYKGGNGGGDGSASGGGGAGSGGKDGIGLNGDTGVVNTGGDGGDGDNGSGGAGGAGGVADNGSAGTDDVLGGGGGGGGGAGANGGAGGDPGAGGGGAGEGSARSAGAGGNGQVSITYTILDGSSSIKTVSGLAKASVKTVNGLAVASVKTINNLA